MIWIDPEEWGRFAWTLLFCSTPTNQHSDTMVKLWCKTMEHLPSVLPCITCRKCCESYLKHTGPPRAESTFVERILWLMKLRRGIHNRNITKGNVSQEMAKQKGHLHYLDRKLEDNNFMTHQYRHVLDFPPLLHFHFFVFMICSAATMDSQRERMAREWFRGMALCLDIALPTDSSVERSSIPQLIQRYSVYKQCPPVGMLRVLFGTGIDIHYT